MSDYEMTDFTRFIDRGFPLKQGPAHWESHAWKRSTCGLTVHIHAACTAAGVVGLP